MQSDFVFAPHAYFHATLLLVSVGSRPSILRFWEKTRFNDVNGIRGFDCIESFVKFESLIHSRALYSKAGHDVIGGSLWHLSHLGRRWHQWRRYFDKQLFFDEECLVIHRPPRSGGMVSLVSGTCPGVGWRYLPRKRIMFRWSVESKHACGGRMEVWLRKSVSPSLNPLDTYEFQSVCTPPRRMRTTSV